MKTIKFTAENRGEGLGGVFIEVWNSWKLLDGGTFSENEENFIMTNNKKDVTFIASKTRLKSLYYNKYIDADLENFEIYEGKNSIGGSFILYRLKGSLDVFIITNINGPMDGTSIFFEII